MTTLQTKGYNVVTNGTQVGPLSRCSVTGVHNPAGPDEVDAMGVTTVPEKQLNAKVASSGLATFFS